MSTPQSQVYKRLVSLRAPGVYMALLKVGPEERTLFIRNGGTPARLENPPELPDHLKRANGRSAVKLYYRLANLRAHGLYDLVIIVGADAHKSMAILNPHDPYRID